MKEEDRELLLLDLCGRLPYWVKGASCDMDTWTLDRIWTKKGYESVVLAGDYYDIEDFKPFLFPLSSMTEEQREELVSKHLGYYQIFEGIGRRFFFEKGFEIYDWFNKNHFDYRGLINKGLAIDATNKNIY